MNLKVKKSIAGLGLFTLEPIKRGEFVIEYTGEKISDVEADRRGGKYLFELNSKWHIDGKGRENTARYLNHSCTPNCEPEVKRGKILISAKKNIAAGEELTYNYGPDYWKRIIGGAKNCRCPKCTTKRNAANS